MGRLGRVSEEPTVLRRLHVRRGIQAGEVDGAAQSRSAKEEHGREEPSVGAEQKDRDRAREPRGKPDCYGMKDVFALQRMP
jgi:hypothetical protein